MIAVKTLKDKLDLVSRNPSAIQRINLDLVEAAENGTMDVVDPSNSFVLCMESSAVTAASLISNHETLLRKMYPSMAQSDEDLYRHMSDIDYIGRFASPATTSFTLMIGETEFRRRAVSTGQGNVKKLVIPRNTQFVVDGVCFSLQYPIEMRIMSSGHIEIVYDASKESPLQTLTTNIVEWTPVLLNRTRYLRLTIPVTQFQLKTYYTKVGSAAGVTIAYTLRDNFYYCRVFSLDSEGKRDVEFVTTHTDQVYNANVPTASLQVAQNGRKLSVYIPEIYRTKGFLQTSLRIDVYTTKGPIRMALATYSPDSYQADWRDEDKDDGGVFVAPLADMADKILLCDRTVEGGADAISFETLKDRVINHANFTSIPITDAQMKTRLEMRGYEMLKSKDNITSRIYLACRRLPPAEGSSFLDGAGSVIKTLEISSETLSAMPYVNDHGNRLTILPQSLFESVDGRLRMVTDTEAIEIANMSDELLVTTFNKRQFLYTPFHYVFDSNNDAFTTRGYYLDNPQMHDPYFIAENDTALLEVATGQYALQKVAEGYEVTLVTRSGTTFQDLADENVHVQLAFVPPGETEHCYLNGTLVGKQGKERVYRFLLETTFDVDANDNLMINNFAMFVTEPKSFPFGLASSMKVLYAVSDYQVYGLEKTPIDVLLGMQLLPANAVGVLEDQINMTLGHALTGLWHNSRTVTGSQKYATWEFDIMKFYDENVYLLDSLGNKQLVVDDEGNVSLVLLHSKGDPVLDEEGNQEVLYKEGWVKRDAAGDPILLSDRNTVRQVDLFLIDGVYMASTDPTDMAYAKQIPVTIVNYLIEDIAVLSKTLLENTELYFYPITSLGKVNVLVDNHIETQIDSSLSFQVRYYLTAEGYGNSELRAAIHESTKRVIYETLQRDTISTSEIAARLETTVGGDAMAVDVGRMGEDRNIAVFTPIDKSIGCSVKRKLVVLPEGLLQVQDAIDVEFIRHQL